jgi:ferredoxin
MWALRGLRNGVLTTRWPARPDQYAAATRGPATVLPGPAAAAVSPAEASRLCPARAITFDPAGRLRLDQGGCILCGRCVTARPDVFAWSAGPGSAALTRTGLVVPPDESQDSLAAVTSRIAARTRALRRSAHLRHVDA